MRGWGGGGRPRVPKSSVPKYKFCALSPHSPNASALRVPEHATHPLLQAGKQRFVSFLGGLDLRSRFVKQLPSFTTPQTKTQKMRAKKRLPLLVAAADAADAAAALPLLPLPPECKTNPLLRVLQRHRPCLLQHHLLHHRQGRPFEIPVRLHSSRRARVGEARRRRARQHKRLRG